MPIGKNAIKRVENNGYSKVKTAAPDMENSSVIPNISEEVMEKMVKPVEKKTEAKKTAPAKKPATKKAEPVKTAPAKKAAPAKKSAAKKDNFAYVNVGKELPYYLL